MVYHNGQKKERKLKPNLNMWLFSLTLKPTGDDNVLANHVQNILLFYLINRNYDNFAFTHTFKCRFGTIIMQNYAQLYQIMGDSYKTKQTFTLSNYKDYRLELLEQYR